MSIARDEHTCLMFLPRAIHGRRLIISLRADDLRFADKFVPSS